MRVRLADLPEIVNQIGNQVLENGYYVDHIVFVDRAGRLLGSLLSERLGCGASGILVTKPGPNLETFISTILKLAPGIAKIFVRKLILMVFRVIRRRNIKYAEKIPSTSRRILIVDDAIDTGETINAVKEYILELYKGNPPSIRVAAINTTLSNRKIKPDFVCFERKIISFPWSSDSLEKAGYRELLNGSRVSIALSGEYGDDQ